MRTIIAGCRYFYDYRELLIAIEEASWTPTTVLSGKCRGVDGLGETWANENKIPIDPYPALWKKYGKYLAPRIRNEEMAKNAEALIALWDFRSTGTKMMINYAEQYNLIVSIHNISK